MDDTILHCIQVLKGKKWIDLTHEVTSEIPYFSSFKPMEEKTLFTVEKNGFLAKEYTLVTQYGTHIDAPSHFASGNNFLEDLSFDQFILPLYVINKEKEVNENPDYEVTIEDILTFEATYGKIPEGSFVAFASGWSKRFNDHKAFYNLDEWNQAHTPGWSIEALKFLNEKRNICAIGHETLDTDSAVTCTKSGDLIGERYWLSQNKFQVEVLNKLTEVPAVGSALFLGVPKIKQAPGFTVRAFAVVPTNET